MPRKNKVQSDSIPAKSTPKTKRSLAEKADKFDCYQRSVQAPEHEVEFFEQAFKEAYRRKPISLREDFCGTFAICCEWVQSNSQRTAIGVDLCAATLQWGRDHNLKKLQPAQQQRVRLIEQDVRKKNRPTVDILAAQNFSFWIFKSRPEVVEYFRAARANLNPAGILVMDMMGGADCFREDNVDKRIIKKGKKGFKYIWRQVSFNPVNHDAKFSISFKFKDGSELKNAFEYDWRFWSIPEVREMLTEAGFTDSHCYFEVENEDDEEDEETGDQWARAEVAPSHPVWLAYIVAIR